MWAFAVSPTTAQLTWRSLPPATVTVETTLAGRGQPSEGPALTLSHGGGPGSVTVTGLAPGRPHRLLVRAAGEEHRLALRTLPALHGPELSRFATINDIHIGDHGFGIVVKQRAPELAEGFSTVCARAAIAEAVAWGAQALVVKGDLTHSSRTRELEEAAALLADVPVPVIGVIGNHDVVRKGVDAAAVLARAGIDIGGRVRALDLAGIRLVVLPTAHDGHYAPRITAEDLEAATTALGEAPGPAWLGLHHYLQPLPVPLTYPPGLPSGAARRLLAAVGGANPSVLVSTGHSHRCRRHVRQGIVVTEVGATKDFPGVWARLRRPRERHPPGRAPSRRPGGHGLDGPHPTGGRSPVGVVLAGHRRPALLHPPLAGLIPRPTGISTGTRGPLVAGPTTPVGAIGNLRRRVRPSGARCAPGCAPGERRRRRGGGRPARRGR